MHRIDGPGHASNLFTEGDPSLSIPATVVTDDWCNDVQEEVCNVIEDAGITLIKGTQIQLRDAIQAMIDLAIGNLYLFPEGTVMLFYQAAAPAGWTQIGTQNDKLLRVVSSAGGGVGGDWQITGLSSNSVATGVTVNNHTLTIAQIPAHSHTIAVATDTIDAGTSLANPYNSLPASTVTSNNEGGGGGHNHGVSDPQHSHTISHSPGWRPAYINVIQASRDAI